MDNYGAADLIQKLCSTVVNNRTPLGITREEASSLMEGMAASEDFREKIRKIKSNREKIKLTRHLKIQKYFEVVGHTGIIERTCFDNSSRYAFSGGADGVIKCWDIREGMVIRSLYSHASMISDLCISKDGHILVSVDYQGVMNIWCLSEFRVLHSARLSSEAIFCEFTYSCGSREASLAEGKCYHVFIILASGIVKTLGFTRDAIVSEKENRFMLGESIKAICITDGGRFVICGGWWPFFLVYDTKDLDTILVFENFRVQALCAAKNSLKFAASSDNQIYSYTFYCEGPSPQRNTKRRTGRGCWKKCVSTIDNDYFIEWLCYLPSFLLVASCTDDVIRIYEDDQMIVSFGSEVGSIYSHPFKNVFAVVGTKLTIYQLSRPDEFCEFGNPNSFSANSLLRYNLSCSGELTIPNPDEGHMRVDVVFSENIYINLNDCQFSEDGRYFITCDDQGVVRAYSVEKPVTAPEEQFFLTDFDRTQPCEDFDATYNMSKQKNLSWIRTEYSITGASIPESTRIENLAAQTLEKDKLDEAKFRSLYFLGDVLSDDTNHRSSDNDGSGSDAYSISVDIDNTELSGTSHYTESSSPLRIDRRVTQPSMRSQARRGESWKRTESGQPRIRRALVVESSTTSIESSVSGEPSKSRRRLQKLKKYDGRYNRVLVDSESSSSSSHESLEKTRGLRRHVRKAAIMETLRRSSRISGGDVGGHTEASSINTHRRMVESSSSETSVISEDGFSRARKTCRSYSNSKRIPDSTAGQGRRVPRRASIASNRSEALESQNDIDPEFEEELRVFSRNWLAFCPIHEGVEVFFNSESYREFMSLEPRIRYGRRVPESGIYWVSSLKMMSIGKVPYVSVVLDGQGLVSFYEYPDSRGILCTKDQYIVRKGNKIRLWVSGQLLSGMVADTDGMSVRVERSWHLKSRIVIEYDPLDVCMLSCPSRAIRPLFDMDRTNKHLRLPIDYAVVNARIENRLYRRKEDLLSDLRMIADAARGLGGIFEAASSQIYHEYAQMLLED